MRQCKAHLLLFLQVPKMLPAPKERRAPLVLKVCKALRVFRVSKASKGLPGIQGNQGSQGVDGLISGVTRRTSISATDSNSIKTVVIECVSGEIMLSGGAEVVPGTGVSSNQARNLALTASFPSSGLAWTATAVEGDNANGIWSLNVNALSAPAS